MQNADAMSSEHVVAGQNQAASDRFYLSDDFAVEITEKSFEHTSSYTADVITVGNQVQGGGTRVSTFHTDGFDIFVRNKSGAQLQIHLMIELYEDPVHTILKGRRELSSLPLRSGVGAHLDLDLGSQTLFPVVSEVIAGEARFRPDWDLSALVPPRPGPPPRPQIAKGLLRLAGAGAVAAIVAVLGYGVLDQISANSRAAKWQALQAIVAAADDEAGIAYEKGLAKQYSSDEPTRRKLAAAFAHQIDVQKNTLEGNTWVYGMTCEYFLLNELRGAGFKGPVQFLESSNRMKIGDYDSLLPTLPDRKAVEGCLTRFPRPD